MTRKINDLIPVSNVPALGYKTLYLERGHMGPGRDLGSAIQPSPGQLSLRNESVGIVVDKTSGCIISIVERKSGIESLAPGACGNQLQFFKDLPKQYDAWNIDPGTFDVTPMTIEKADSVEIIGADIATPGIRITFHWQNSKFTRTSTSKATRSTLRTTLTGTRSTSCSRRRFRWR